MIVRFLEMVAQMKFEEKPNYDKFRQTLRQGLKEGGYPDDGVLVFPSLNKTGATVAKSPAKKRSAVQPPKDEESENSDVKQRAKTGAKKAREPCSPKVTNRLQLFRIIFFLNQTQILYLIHILMFY